MIRKIIQTPNQILNKTSDTITTDEIGTSELNQLITDMQDTLSHQPIGAGISAVQVGVTKRVFITKIKPFGSMSNSPYIGTTVFINPEIVKESKIQVIMEEGCLSIGKGNMFGEVERPKEVELKWLDQKGNIKQDKFDEFMARVILHEMDHLEGILFTSKVIGELETIEQVRAKRRKNS